MHFPHAALLVLVSLTSGCSVSHATCDLPDAAPTDARAPCPPGLVDEGDACVGWRGIPSPPCEPEAMVLCGAEVAVACDGLAFVLTAASTWEQRDDVTTTIAEEHDGPPLAAGPRLSVRLPDGVVATHGDLYAIPAAWRVGADGTWRDTVPTPSAWLTHSAAISDHEALFIGRDAYVFTWLPR